MPVIWRKPEHKSVAKLRWVVPVLAAWIGITQASRSAAEPIPVRHPEGMTFGFLVIRDLNGNNIGNGELKQVVKEKDEPGVVTDDLRLVFKDGSLYHEITKFTQRGKFRLVSDQVEQKGPSFKEQCDSWIDPAKGTVTVRIVKDGKPKMTTKHLDLPADLANGLLLVLLKNLNPSAPQTTVSYVTTSATPRVVKWEISPAHEKIFKVGLIEAKAQHYVVKTKIEGVEGKLAPLVGKQPPDLNVWLVKSQAPTFLKFEGPLSEDNPVWRIELTAPDADPPKTK